MIHSGGNFINGVPVDVERKRVRRISIRVKSDGRVAVSVPKGGATLAEAEAFLRSKWKWVLKVRAETLARPPSAAGAPPTGDEVAALSALLGDLTARWAARLGEHGVTWKVRAMKTLWGSCHIVRRRITYNRDLAKVPRELVEYVVVHELTHLKAASHGPRFYALMDARLPGWKDLRRRLNKREFWQRGAAEATRGRIPQPELAFDFVG